MKIDLFRIKKDTPVQVDTSGLEDKKIVLREGSLVEGYITDEEPERLCVRIVIHGTIPLENAG